MARNGEKRRISASGALPALVAVLALLVQALIPASAMAQEFRSRASTQTVILCTADGARSVEVAAEKVPGQEHHTGFAGLKCHDCVMVSIAAVMPPAGDPAPVRYSQIIRVELTRTKAGRAIERPAPRPPSQGPPGRVIS